MTDSRLLYYSIGPDVEAFTTMRDAELPYPVLCGHQVHGIKVGIVDREGMTREDFEGYDALKWLLMSNGVKEENIFISDIDTYTDERFFSARREGFECGRSITAIKLGD